MPTVSDSVPSIQRHKIECRAGLTRNRFGNYSAWIRSPRTGHV
jgi:hypothetical protein